jgi:hypothetical protein
MTDLLNWIGVVLLLLLFGYFLYRMVRDTL